MHRVQAAPRPFPQGPLLLRLFRIPASCPELVKINPALGGNSGASREEQRPNKSECHDHERDDCRRHTTSQTSGLGPRAASSSLLPSASSQNSSKPTAVSTWVSLVTHLHKPSNQPLSWAPGQFLPLILATCLHCHLML